MNIAQIIVSSLITAAELGSIAIGLTMTFSILRFANFAHASMAVIGAYIAYTLNLPLGWPLWLAFLVSMLIMGCFGIVVDRVIFRALREAGELTPMIASLPAASALTCSMLRWERVCRPPTRLAWTATAMTRFAII